jgi:hypothetical protein
VWYVAVRPHCLGDSVKTSLLHVSRETMVTTLSHRAVSSISPRLLSERYPAAHGSSASEVFGVSLRRYKMTMPAMASRHALRSRSALHGKRRDRLSQN